MAYDVRYSFYGANRKAFRCRDPEVILAGPADTGKAQPLDVTVWTLTGPKSMGNVKIGDKVLTPDGGHAPVLAVYPQDMMPVYRLTFWRDDAVECTFDHLWALSYIGGGKRNGNKVREMRCLRTVAEIQENYLIGRRRPRPQYWVPQCRPLGFQPRPVPIDSYVLGQLLGDGHLGRTGITISTSDEQTLVRLRQRLGKKYKITHKDAYDYHIGANGFWPRRRAGELWGDLDRLGLLGCLSYDKFVPDVYKFNEPAVRLDVLRGLLDSDGTIDRQAGGMPSYSTSSGRLAQDVKYLTESLGGAATITPRHTAGRISYRVRLRYDQNKELFLLERKRRLAKNRTKYPVKRMLTDISYVGLKECQCILVGHPSGLYLTDHCIPTHNTLALLTKLHRIALAPEYKKASLVIVRKRQTDAYSTVLQTFQEKILGENAPVSLYGGEKAQWFDYPDKSRIWVAGLDKAGKVLSAEFDCVYVNQAEELSLAEWETLTTRTTGRAGHMPYSQTIGDCNPATPTHWIKQRTKTGSLTLFESTHKDNPALYDQETGLITEAGELRLANLKRLTGSRYLRLFKGLWAFPEGAIYSMFDEERHKVKSFPIPQLWGRAVGIDPFGAAIAALWVAFDPKAQVLNVYREYVEPFGLTTAQHAKKIRDKSAHEWISVWCGGGPSERAWRLEWEAAGIPLLEPPVGDVWIGIDRIIELLNDFRLVIHDNCQNLLSEIGSYRRKMKNGVVTESIEDKETYHCLVGDTLVATAKGNVPLRDVVVGDRVLTRQGYRRVLGSACTHPCAPVYEVRLSNGATLIGTAEHPVWVKSKGYADLRALRYGDILVTSNDQEVSQWERVEKRRHAEHLTRHGCVTQILGDGAISISKQWCRFTAMSGKCFMADQFRRVMSFITLMGTRRITTLRTLLPCPRPSIQGYTFHPAMISNDCASSLRSEENTPRLGTARRLDGSFTESWANSRGKVHTKLSRPVRAAARPMRRGTLPKHAHGFALTNAKPLSGASLAQIMKLESVKPAGKSLQSTNTAEQRTARANARLRGELEKRKQRFAPTAGNQFNTIWENGGCTAQENVIMPAHVVSVELLNECKPVYNLEVEGAHEFFANGILVHNCLDALRYIITMITQPGSGVEVVYNPVKIGAGL